MSLTPEQAADLAARRATITAAAIAKLAQAQAQALQAAMPMLAALLHRGAAP